MNILRKIAAGIAARKERIVLWAKKLGLAAVGHSLKQFEEILFDHILYGAVAYASLEYSGFAYSFLTGQSAAPYFGAVYGPFITFAIMTPLSAYMCLKYVKLYDWSKKDWFGFETLKEARAGIKREWVRKALEKSDAFGFVFWCINGDPFMVAIYCRKEENRYEGLTARDKRIFWGAVLFSNGWWTLRWYVIMWAIYFWDQIQGAALYLCQLARAC